MKVKEDQVTRTVFADQFPPGHDLAQAARDSLIRYCRRFGIRINMASAHTQWGTRWATCWAGSCWAGHAPGEAAHQVYPLTQAVQITATVHPTLRKQGG